MSHKRRSPKKRSQTYAQLKRALDKVFSLYIRQRDADPQGMVKCVSCANVAHWETMQCGHYISRVHLSTRWDERNCAAQDYACNILRRGNVGEFTLALQAKYGPSIIQELVDKKRSPVKYTRSDLQERIEYYKTALANIAKP